MQAGDIIGSEEFENPLPPFGKFATIAQELLRNLDLSLHLMISSALIEAGVILPVRSLQRTTIQNLS